MAGGPVDGTIQALRLHTDESAAEQFRSTDPARTFEHTLSYLIDEKIDLSVFEARYKNDNWWAPARYDPTILLKIILFAYSKGII